MTCITVRQPWAWMIIHGGGTYENEPIHDGIPGREIRYGFKNIENRKWRTEHRGPLLIHAGKIEADYDDTYQLAEKMYYAEYGEANGLRNPIPDYLDYGAIIGQVELIDITRDYPWGHWTMPDHWHWVLGHPQPIQPIPYRGRPGLFNVPDDLLPADDPPF